MTRILALLFSLAACAAPAPAVQSVTLVESAPVETSLGHADIADAHQVWIEMIDSAARSLDVCQFYASNRPGSRLEPIVAAVERAAMRGVKVRFLSSRSFAEIYPKTLGRLQQSIGVELRLTDDLHAKYFVADRREAFLGSQNFDWRALTHIQELGARIRDRQVVAGLAEIFEADWTAAGGEPLAERDPTATPPWSGELELVASPRTRLPPNVAWDLPRLIAMIDGAKSTVRVQLLSYRSGVAGLDRALIDAGARGVDVRVLVSDWNLDERRIGALKALTAKPGVSVGFAAIPAASAGFIPFARVIHAKYLVVDGELYWVGTSNWSPSYFFKSRNVGITARDPAMGATLDRFHDQVWDSDYAEVIDPTKSYKPPRYRE